MTESEHFLFTHGIAFNLYRRLRVAHHLHNSTLVGRKLHEKGWMVLYCLYRSFLQSFGIGLNWEGETYRGIVQR